MLAEFAAVARWQHITRAAEELGIPQPTLSRRIARLERALGVPLLTRRGRGVELTRQGRTLAVALERSLRDVERVLEDLLVDLDATSGSVALAFLHTLGPEVVPRILREFRDSHPEVRFELTQHSHEGVVGRLRDGDADLALTSPLPDDPTLVAVPLHEQRLYLVVPAGHRLEGAERVDLEVAADEPFVGFKHGYGLRQITDDCCRRAGFTPVLAFEGEDVATVRGLVAAGLGVALLPATTGTSASSTSEIELTTPGATRTICMLWAADRALSPPAEAFRRFMMDSGVALVSPQAQDRMGQPGLGERADGG